MAIKKIKLPDNTTKDINDAREVAYITNTSTGLLDTDVGNSIGMIAINDGQVAAFPGCETGDEDYILESTSNKVTSLSSSSTNTQYPSAKCVYDNLASKQNLLYANELIGSMYRNNVAGTGNISINGTSGEFPTVSSAGEYIVVTSMSSSTQSYGLNVNFGGNTYSLTTTDGKIYDSRTVVINSNKTWSASVSGSVASGTIIDVKLYKSSPIVSNVEVTTNKVTSLSASSNDNQYPSAKAVYDIIGDVESLILAL